MKQPINKQFKTYASIQEKDFVADTPVGQGIVRLTGWASKSYNPDGSLVIDRDSENIQSSNFSIDKASVLLYQHDHKMPIGTIKLEHRPEGIKIEAEVHEAMHPVAYYGAKNNILNRFSIGFSVTEAEWVDVGGEDYLSFTKGEIFETSLVSVPANALATVDSITQVKSIIKDGECKGLQCSIESLKAMNPDACDCATLKHLKTSVQKSKGNEGNDMNKIQEIVKGLTFNETEKETWNQYDKLSNLMSILRDTLDDNFFEVIWGEDITADEVRANIKATIETFTDKVLEIEQFKANEIKEKSKPTLVTKSGEESSATVSAEVETTSEGNAEGQTPEIDNQEIEPTKEEQTLTEEVSEVTNEPEPTEPEVIADIAEEDTPKVEVEVPVKPTIQTLIGELATTNLEALSAEEIESLYNSASDITEKIEALVKQEVEDLA